MFEFLKKNVVIQAPCNGTLMALEKVPDQVFAGGMMGPGIAIDPSDGNVTAPVDGICTVVAATGHAFGITMENGLQILVHIGIDTVDMKGEPFTVLKQQDDTVQAGEPVILADLAKIRAAELSAAIPVILTDTRAIGAITYRHPGPVKQGEWIMKAVLK